MSLEFGGAVLKVRVVPFKEYVSLCWYTPSIYTCVLFSLSILLAKVKAVVLPLPVKPSWYTTLAAEFASIQFSADPVEDNTCPELPKSPEESFRPRVSSISVRNFCAIKFYFILFYLLVL